MTRILCWLGQHDWEGWRHQRGALFISRWCRRCPAYEYHSVWDCVEAGHEHYS